MATQSKRSRYRTPLLKRLFVRAGAFVCLGTLLLASGLHTVGIQAYAWGTMFKAYSQVLPIWQAIETTLSGEDLCGICELSQGFQDGMDESFSLYLSDSSPLICLTVSDAQPETPLSVKTNYSPEGQRFHQEVTLTADPPPPRLA